MRPLLVVLALSLAPGLATPVLFVPTQAAAAQSAFGDLSAMRAVVEDALAKTKAGDLAGAQARITDYETAWDAAEPTLRPKDKTAWTSLDHLSDDAIGALRAASPSAESAVPTLETLAAALNDPAMSAAGTPAGGFALSNADGSPVPCEEALAEVRRIIAAKPPAAADQAKIDELQTKGIERCNADDDRRADKIFGEALAILNK